MFALALLSKAAYAFDTPPEAMFDPNHSWNQCAWTPGDWVMLVITAAAVLWLLIAAGRFLFAPDPKHDPSMS